MNSSLALLTISLLIVVLASLMTPTYGAFVGSPNHQLESGVNIEDILCKENKVLVLRSNGAPACVSEKTSERMGWGIINPSIVTPVLENDNIDKEKEIVLDKTLPEEKYEFDLRLGQTSGVKDIPSGSLESVFQITPENVDAFANKISIFVDDKIIDRVEITPDLRYDTQRGSIKIYENNKNYTGFGYAGYPKGTTSFVEGETMAEDLLKEFDIFLDGTEFKQYRTTAYGEHFFKYIQKIDGVYVPSNFILLSFELGINSLAVTNWNNNLSELDLIDLDKAQQIGIDYALQFDSLVSSPCNISMKNRPLHTDEITHTEIRVINGTLVYVVYSGTCDLPSSLMSQDFETTINAQTGEPYFIKRGPSM